MKLTSVEATPNPNSIKLNLDETIAERPLTLKAGQIPKGTPDAVAQLADIQGVQNAFAANNFVTLTREGNADWDPILSAVVRALGLADDADAELRSRFQ